ncbi:MAG: hypothetical protein HRF50_03690 [Phycisphaerae bacterium]
MGVNKDVSSRIFRALARTDSLAAARIMPGPAPLRQLLNGARAKRLPETLIRQLDLAVTQFERLIRVDVGDRGSLDAIICSALPETRLRYELVNKQSVYRGMVQLKGVAANVLLTTAIIFASDEPEYVDGVWVLAWQGLRRIRRDAVACFHTGRIGEQASQDAARTLSGDPIGGPEDVLLTPFCSSPIPPLETRRAGPAIHYLLGGNTVGLSSAVDVVMACRTPRCLKRFDPPERRRLRGPTMEIEVPCKVAVLDAFVEQNVFVEGLPKLYIYDTAISGVADMNDPKRDLDRLDFREAVESLGNGVMGIRIVEIPHYSEIIAEVFQRIGRSPEQFRGYRCRTQYPLYGTQYAMGFTAPVRFSAINSA